MEIPPRTDEKKHARNILKRSNLVPPETNLRNLGGFEIEHKTHVEQHDGWNCLPIACSTLWEVMSEGEFKATEHTPKELRVLVVDKYESMIEEFAEDLQIRMPRLTTQGEGTWHSPRKSAGISSKKQESGDQSAYVCQQTPPSSQQNFSVVIVFTFLVF